MEQATIEGIRQYAGFFNDLRGIATSNHYPLPQDRLKGLEAEFGALSGIVEVVKADPDKDRARVMLWGWAGESWPVLLSLQKRVDRTRAMMVQNPKRSQQEIEATLDAFKDLIRRVNDMTCQIGKALGLVLPIREIEVVELMEGAKCKKAKLAKVLEEYKRGRHTKRDTAIIGLYLYNIVRDSKEGEPRQSYKEFLGNLAGLLNEAPGEYKESYLRGWMGKNKDEADRLGVLMFSGIR